jgi:hypothetical protein
VATLPVPMAQTGSLRVTVGGRLRVRVKIRVRATVRVKIRIRLII